MNALATYIDEINQTLIDNPQVIAVQFVRERITEDTISIRVRATFSDQSTLHFTEYGEIDVAENLRIVTYSYQWMTADNTLLQRWDNAKHYPNLSGFPHHMHDGDEKNVLPGEPMSLTKVLDQIAARLSL